MGKRVEGRKKKKSIKANVTSKFSSKRRLSRMGKKVQAGKAGPNTEFITRSSALRRLQITLKDFRRLCILKGIYPRVPAKGLSGNDKVYYDIKDISYIMHEPLLNKFREFKSFMKKIRKAAGRNQFEEARRKNELKPKVSLDHLVKERYPRFIDALRDLDDALCMIHLFAALPSSGRITTEHTANCAKLSREWQYFVSKSKTLRKVFVSVKGVYFQAEVLGEAVTWLVPHAFTQSLPREVDFRVMVTFLEFYEVFVRFVLFKLFHLRGWQYPPAVDAQLEAEGCCLLAMKTDGLAGAGAKAEEAAKTSQGQQSAKTVDPAAVTRLDVAAILGRKSTGEEPAEAVASEEAADEDEDDEEAQDITAPLLSAFSDLQSFATGQDAAEFSEERRVFHQSDSAAADSSALLFSGLVFFINREVPLDWLQLCITAFGGRVGWEGALSPIKAADQRVTHHLVDRPMQSAGLQSREYVQPQWVFDCINAKVLLPTRLYGPGQKLPPHLSPFVDDEREGYLPQYREEIRRIQGTSSSAAGQDQDEERDEEEDVADDRADEEAEDFQRTIRREKSRGRQQSKAADSASESEEEENEEDDDASESESEDDQEELDELPAAVPSGKKGPKGIVFQRPEEPLDQAAEEKQLSMQMMKKKTKRLYDRMQHGLEKKQQAVQSLLTKRKALEEASPTPAKKAKQPAPAAGKKAAKKTKA